MIGARQGRRRRILQRGNGGRQIAGSHGDANPTQRQPEIRTNTGEVFVWNASVDSGAGEHRQGQMRIVQPVAPAHDDPLLTYRHGTTTDTSGDGAETPQALAAASRMKYGPAETAPPIAVRDAGSARTARSAPPLTEPATS